MTYSCRSYKQERLYMNGGFAYVSTNPASWTKRAISYDNGTVMKDTDGRYMLKHGNQYLNSSKDRLYSHLAVIEDYVASCITFTSPSRVPAGKHHHVSMPYNCVIENIVKINKYSKFNCNEYTKKHFFPAAWHVLER